MQLYPDKPHGFVWLFSAQWHLGEENTSLELANNAILQFPNIEWVWRARAGLAEFANDHALAHEYWQDCIENFPNMVDAYAKSAAINLSMGNTKKAQELINIGLEKSPDDLRLRVSQADVFEQQSKWSQANEQWIFVQNKFPDYAQAYRRSADIFARLQDHLGATNVMMDWIKNGKGVSTKDYTKAADSLIKALTQHPSETSNLKSTFSSLIAQPLDPKSESTVSEITKRVQTLGTKMRPELKDVSSFIEIQFYSENRVANSATRRFAYHVGIPDLNLTHAEIRDLISAPDRSMFCRTFSGYPFHAHNVLALKEFVAQQDETEFLDKVSEAGLKNLHLFAVAEDNPDQAPYRGISRKASIPKISARTFAPALNLNLLRIAVCVSGQLRGYKPAAKSWEHLGLSGQDTHFFVHTWTNTGRKPPDLAGAGRSFSGAFLKAFITACKTYSVKHIQSEYPALYTYYRKNNAASFREISEAYGTHNVVLEDDESSAFSDYTNTMKMYYKMQKSWDMMRESGLDFDLVMRVRPDKKLVPQGDVNWAAMYKTCSTEPVVLVDRRLRVNCHSGLFVGDQFAISTPDLMSVYCNVFSNELNKDGELDEFSTFGDPHKKLGFTLYNAGLRAQENPYIKRGPLLNPEQLGKETLLSLIMEDINNRNQTELDLLFVSALKEDMFHEA